MNIQIEEMTKIMLELPILFSCQIGIECLQCNYFTQSGCQTKLVAEALYNAGYKQEKEIAREIFQKIYTYYKTNSADYLSEYFLIDIKEMAQEFGVEVKQ